MIGQRSTLRLVVLVFAYAISALVSLWLAWQVRFDFSIPEPQLDVFWISIAWIVPLKLSALALAQQYSGLLSFFSVRDLIRLFGAMSSSTGLIVLCWWAIADTVTFIPPRGVILVDFVLSFMGLAGIRFAFRLYRERTSHQGNLIKGRPKKVGIVGAGHSGADLAKELFMRREMGLSPDCFFDDNPEKWNSRLHSVPILGKPEILLDSKCCEELEKLVIALPSASGNRIKEVVDIANRTGLSCEIVPSMEELASGRVRVSQLRRIQIQDLLGRDPVQLEAKNIQHLIQDKVIMVTGAGGSIGSELCRQILNYNARRLLLVEQCEVQLFTIEQELVKLGFEGIIVPLVSDVLHVGRMESIFQRFKPNLVFHAAAHKHVALMEQQPAEAFRNNTLGTVIIADMAVQHAVSHFLLVSTDKAINPTSVMGATKRLAEIFLQSLYAANDTATKFMAVRFGNVLGSSGSVVPIFEKQINEGGAVTVTHPEVTRYFMIIPEAVGLVLQACAQATGGEIFVLDMGEPVKIIDLARQLIELHGHKPDEDIEIKFTGLRPGEKLFEELSHAGENTAKTNHPKIMKFISKSADLIAVRKELQELNEKVHHLEPEQIKMLFKQLIPEYFPFVSQR
ncbi:polysaccharide biosynthesis protein [bacterium]|nr:polysaccharide biosynthesis protein [bacterium]